MAESAQTTTNAAAPLVQDGEMSLAAFDRVQTALYGAVGRDEAWHGVVQAIAQALKADVACWCTTYGQGPHAASFYAA